jgi:hypothetical protein
MEEFRFDWTPLVKSAITKIVEGQTILVVTDSKREWFSKYIRSSINSSIGGRPFLPVYDLEGCFPNLASINTAEELDLLEDMLDISFPNGYFIWYIGDGKHSYTKLTYRSDDSLLWVTNEQIPNSFVMRDSDPLLDIKLIQLYKLFDKTIEAVLFGEVELEE